jgi:hypothetical protein
LERSDNVADGGHAFAVLKRGYTSEEISGWRLPPACFCAVFAAAGVISSTP